MLNGSSATAEISRVDVITPFEVIQGYQFRYQWKVHTPYFLLMNIINLYPIYHQVYVIVNYWSNFAVWYVRIYLSTAIVCPGKETKVFL